MTKRIFRISFLIFSVCFVVLALYYLDGAQDDAFISFRYAKNLAEGNGLRFNPGMPAVEGYSNFLWVMLLAVGYKCGFNLLVLSKVLGLGFGVASIYFTLKLSAEWTPDRPALGYILAGTALATSWYFAVWAVEGLETLMFAFFVVAGIYNFLGEANASWRPTSGLLFTLASLTRPEGPLFMVAATILVTLFAVMRKMSWRALALTLGVFVFFYGPYLIWKFIYFDDLLPGPFYAKVPTHASLTLKGLKYVYNYVLSLSMFRGIFILLSLSFFLVKSYFEISGKESGVRYTTITVFALLYIAFIVLVGGDWMAMYRFMVPLMPLIAIMFAAAASRLMLLVARHQAGLQRLLVPVVVVLFAGAQIYAELPSAAKRPPVPTFSARCGWYGRLRYPDVAKNGPHYRTAKLVDTIFFPDDLVALSEAGIIPYYSRQPMVDYLGLNDLTVAKMYYNHRSAAEIAQYVLSLSPQGIVMAAYLDPRSGDVIPRLPAEKGILADTAFSARYLLLHKILLARNVRIPSLDTLCDQYFLIFGRLADASRQRGITRTHIDWDNDTSQIGRGWYQVEGKPPNARRWTKREAEFYLPVLAGASKMRIEASVPNITDYERSRIEMRIYLDSAVVVDTAIFRTGEFTLSVNLPRYRPTAGVWTGRVLVDTVKRERSIGDRRELGIVIKKIEMS